MNPNALLTLVGGGPGDPDLITLKAIKALRDADVVLYDALINKEILEHAPKAEHIFVGKRKGMHRFSQDEINRLIVEKATKKGHVVRLKGGDPFVFGRGSEEIEYTQTFGIPTCIVPGISSSIAVPSNCGIPLTQRGISESFWVITGCTSDRKLSADLHLAARSTATIVVLMGLHKLEEICKILEEEGKGLLPAAIIQNGTATDERILSGTVVSIVEDARDQKIGSPALIVFGEVVRFHQELRKVNNSFNLVKAS